MPNPVRALRDADGSAFLVMDNGHRIRLPGSSPAGTPDLDARYVNVAGDMMTGKLQIITTSPGGYDGGRVELLGASGGASLVLEKGSESEAQLFVDGQVWLDGDPPYHPTHAVSKAYADTYTDWASVTVASGWRDYAGRPHKLTKASGMVTLEANFQPTSNLAIAANVATLMATLPVGFRPVDDMGYPVTAYSGASGTPVRTYYPAMAFVAAGTGAVSLYVGTALTMGADGAVFVNPAFRKGN